MQMGRGWEGRRVSATPGGETRPVGIETLVRTRTKPTRHRKRENGGGTGLLTAGLPHSTTFSFDRADARWHSPNT